MFEIVFHLGGEGTHNHQSQTDRSTFRCGRLCYALQPTGPNFCGVVDCGGDIGRSVYRSIGVGPSSRLHS